MQKAQDTLRTKLRNTLRINAAFSGVNALVMLTFPEVILNHMLLNSGPEAVGWGVSVAVGLLVFAVFVLAVSLPARPSGLLVSSIIVQDFAWVAGSIVIVVLGLIDFSLAGVLLTAGIALVVAVFAIMQLRFLRQLRLS